MSEDLVALGNRISDLEKRLAKHQRALVEASRQRHAYLSNSAFELARLVMLLMALLGSAVLGVFAHYVGLDLIGRRFALILGIFAFFFLFWLSVKGSKRLEKQKEKDEEALPAFPEWQARNNG